MTIDTKLTRQSPVVDLWLAVAQQPGFEGLRKECFGRPYYTMGGERMREHGPNPNTRRWCKCRSGLGWAVNQDRDVLENCIRERGWSLFIEVCPEGDGVVIADTSDHNLLTEPSIIGSCQDEGLRGTHAVVVAVAQALGLIGGAR